MPVATKIGMMILVISMIHLKKNSDRNLGNPRQECVNFKPYIVRAEERRDLPACFVAAAASGQF